jgi:Secretion system C-terminal sorting domain
VSPYVATVAGVNAFSPFVVANQNALSVELLDFKGTPQYNGNLLTWTTASEVNNKGFNVERLMINGEWLMLGFVNAACRDKACLVSTLPTTATYNFIDNQPFTTSYYRLRQIDNDGKETLSKVISVSTKGNGKIKVYPNPVSNVLTIETDLTNAYQVINFLGQQVMTGNATQRLDVSALPKGAYFLRVGTEQVRFVKQ